MNRFSQELNKNDILSFKEILNSTAFFYDFEIDIVVDIFNETLAKGQEESGYYWTKLLNEDNRILGFAIYGPNPSTIGSWDFYWLAISNEFRNKHLGTLLLKEIEKNTRLWGGKILWIETSGRLQYLPTRKFYDKCNYIKEASLKDYYGVGDDKVIYKKIL
ncbi:MAG: GNAT family N-acetyltransferase [Bacteroidales bacterium]